MCPIYELYCKKCDRTEEDLMSYDRYKSETFKCDKCNTVLEKQVSGCAFVLFGQGFYKPSKRE